MHGIVRVVGYVFKHCIYTRMCILNFVNYFFKYKSIEWIGMERRGRRMPTGQRHTGPKHKGQYIFNFDYEREFNPYV